MLHLHHGFRSLQTGSSDVRWHQHLCVSWCLYLEERCFLYSVGTTSKLRASVVSVPPLRSSPRRGRGAFGASASTPRHLAHLFLSLLRLTLPQSTKATPGTVSGEYTWSDVVEWTSFSLPVNLYDLFSLSDLPDETCFCVRVCRLSLLPVMTSACHL